MKAAAAIVLAVLLLSACGYTIAHHNPDGTATTWECSTLRWKINPAGFTPAQVEYQTDLPGTTAAITELHYNGTRYDGGYIKVDPGLGSFFPTMAWHEVGHAYGLGHTPDGQVMSPDSVGPPYRSGDLAGLAAVGCP